MKNGIVKTFYRSIFISDPHLGSPFSQEDKLLNFLDTTKCENLYFVGDTIDFFHLYEHHGWSNKCNLILRRVFAKVGKNTKIKICIGNHDAFLGILNDFKFGNIEVAHEFIHHNHFMDYLVLHGDKFDSGLNYFSLSKFICFVNTHCNWFPFINLARNLADKFSHRNMKWKKLKEYCLTKSTEGCIIGHTHIPGFDQQNQIWNCGDWVTNCTAIVEDESHELTLKEIK